MNFQDQRRGEVEKTEIPQFAVVTSVDESGLQLIFDGEKYPTKKRYKYNTALTFKVGDRVRVSKQSGSYIVEYPVGTTKFTTPPYGPSGIKFSYTENSVSINWSDPSDKTSGDDVIAKWAGTYLVRNESRIPLDETDGTVLVNNKVKDAYKTSSFVDTGLITGKTYYYNLFTYSDQNKVNRDYVGFSVTPIKVFKYGIRIDENNSDPDTAVTYLYDAVGKRPAKVNLQTGEFDYGDWADVEFVKDCKPCMLRYDGTVDYYLNPNDYSQKEDGTPSDIANPDYQGNAMVEFPLWYITTETPYNAGYIEITVSNAPISEKSTAYAFMGSADKISPKMYIAIYLTSQKDGGKMQSIASANPKLYSIKDFEENKVPESVGEKYNVSSWTQREYIGALLMIMAKSLNTQEKFGWGPQTPYQTTGYVNKMFFGMGSASDRMMSVFYLQNWWGDPYNALGIAIGGHYSRVGNVLSYYKDFCVKAYPPYYTYGISNDEYTYRKSKAFPISGKYLKKTTGFLPVDVTGSSTTFYCSYCEIEGTKDDWLETYRVMVGDRRSGAIGMIQKDYTTESYFRLTCYE